MTDNQPQSIVSSRIHTNAAFQIDETRAQGNKDKVALGLEQNNNYNKLQEVKNEEDGSQNKLNNIDIESIDFDDKIGTKTSHWYINCNRLLYSKNCIYFYIFLIIFSLAVFAYSIVGFFSNLSTILT